MPEKTPVTNFLLALPSEARPLVEALGLAAQDGRRGARLYLGESARVLVTGLGKTAMAAGVGYLAGAFPEPAIWLNVGIAGHRSRAVGEALMVNTALDPATGASHYPPLVVEPPVATTRLVTVDRPESVYPDDVAYDMEGAAFFAAARRFQTAELVQSVKIVSDGPEAPIDGLTRERVRALVTGALPAILELRRRLEPLAAELVEAERESPEEAAPWLERWHFSVSDRHALRRELRRRRVLGASMPETLFADARRGRDVVRALRAHLDELAVSGPGR